MNGDQRSTEAKTRNRQLERAQELAALAAKSHNPAARAAYLQLAAAFRDLADRHLPDADNEV